uniref:Uncharacterized protein n=1 Tax=Hanusia phi TaxID=3032 RepID=A0A7S0EZJ6_9CRYP
MDLAGKLPLAVKALSIGVSVDELLIDVAQAGGLHGKSDGSIVHWHRGDHGDVLSPRVAVDIRQESIEVKSCSSRRGCQRTFGVKSIRGPFKHLFIVARQNQSDTIMMILLTP